MTGNTTPEWVKDATIEVLFDENALLRQIISKIFGPEKCWSDDYIDDSYEWSEDERAVIESLASWPP